MTETGTIIRSHDRFFPFSVFIVYILQAHLLINNIRSLLTQCAVHIFQLGFKNCSKKILDICISSWDIGYHTLISQVRLKIKQKLFEQFVWIYKLIFLHIFSDFFRIRIQNSKPSSLKLSSNFDSTWLNHIFNSPKKNHKDYTSNATFCATLVSSAFEFVQFNLFRPQIQEKCWKSPDCFQQPPATSSHLQQLSSNFQRPPATFSNLQRPPATLQQPPATSSNL